MAVHESEPHQTTPSAISRRGFLVILGVALNALAATLLASLSLGMCSRVFATKRCRSGLCLDP